MRKGAVSGWEEFGRVALKAGSVVRDGTKDEETYIGRGVGSKIEEKLSGTMAATRSSVNSNHVTRKNRCLTCSRVKLTINATLLKVWNFPARMATALSSGIPNEQRCQNKKRGGVHTE